MYLTSATASKHNTEISVFSSLDGKPVRILALLINTPRDDEDRMLRDYGWIRITPWQLSAEDENKYVAELKRWAG